MSIPKKDLIGKRFGKLTVEFDLFGDGHAFFCRCDCGNSRKVSRQRLINGGSSMACVTCATESQRNGKHKPDMLLVPEPVVVRSKAKPCLGCVDDGVWLRIQPDCPVHSPLYGTVIMRGPELVGGRSITTFRKAGMASE